MKKTIGSLIFFSFFVVYLFLTLDLLLFSRLPLFLEGHTSRSLNLLPFHTIGGYLSGEYHVSHSLVIHNLLGNIVLFLPMGIYTAALLKPGSIGRCLAVVFSFSLFAETLQWVFGIGAADVDDLILNCTGGMLGILGYQGLLKVMGTRRSAYLFITMASTAVGLPVLYITIATYLYNL